MASPSVRVATPRDLRFVLHLARRETDAVGFLPREAVESYLDAGAVAIAMENDAPAGYLLVKDSLSSCPAIRPILQAAVCYDARRRCHGLELVALVERQALEAGRKIIQLKCREELQANLFWHAAGFQPIATQPAGRRRGGRVIVWAKQVLPITPADLILKKVERHRGPGGFYSSKPLELSPVTDISQVLPSDKAA
jgi:hypothetical protein